MNNSSIALSSDKTATPITSEQCRREGFDIVHTDDGGLALAFYDDRWSPAEQQEIFEALVESMWEIRRRILAARAARNVPAQRTHKTVSAPSCPDWCEEHDDNFLPAVIMHISKDRAMSASGIDDYSGPLAFSMYRCDRRADNYTMINPQWVVGEVEVYADVPNAPSIRFANLTQVRGFQSALLQVAALGRVG